MVFHQMIYKYSDLSLVHHFLLSLQMDTYYNFMISQDPTIDYVGIMAISHNDIRMGILPTLLSMKCPVGVTIYNDVGEIMAYESQQATATYLEEQTAVTSDVVSWISEDGEKVFFIPYGSDASSVSIEAYDYGTMTFSIAKVDALTNHYSEIKTFNNINFYADNSESNKYSFRDLAIEVYTTDGVWVRVD